MVIATRDRTYRLVLSPRFFFPVYSRKVKLQINIFVVYWFEELSVWRGRGAGGGRGGVEGKQRRGGRGVLISGARERILHKQKWKVGRRGD